MNWPQITLLVLTGGHLLAVAHMHGKPRESQTHSFPMALADAAILIFLLWKGGFFT